jgi:signal transduction histidine kinase
VPDRRPLVVWLAVVYAHVVVRLKLWQVQRASSRAPDYDARRFARIWTVGAGVSGVLWGIAGALLFPPESVGGQYFVLFLIGGMVAGASASMSSLLSGYVAFSAPALAGMIARLFLEGERLHTVAGLLLVIFGVAMTVIAKSSGDTLAQSIRLRMRNELLLADLTSAREALTRLNAELEGRVAARTSELETALGDRDRFVSVFSHELRTPLTSMMLNVENLEMLLGSDIRDAARLGPPVAALARQTKRMRHLIEDLLDTSRLSADRMRYSKTPVTLREIVDASLEDVAPQLASARATFAVEIEDGLRGNWDAYRIEQVFTNLLSNALRYGAPPFSLRATRAGSSARVVVRDSGAGIPEERRRRIFEPFETFDGGRGRAGLGLGLYIADRLVRAHDGTIRVESEPGRGSEFIVELPLL